jgi:predicted HAD superfamily Cof-like phosphohydrolase
VKTLLNDLRAFHTACATPILTSPQFPTQDRIDLRDRLLKEEVKELDDAVVARDLVEVADALGDIIYIAVGTALEFGIPLDRVWAEIQRSNMAKVDPATGVVKKRADGKILKPEGWTPPDIAGALTA